MQQISDLLEILGQEAKPFDGPDRDFELTHNGTVIVVRFESHRDFDHASAALQEAQRLAALIADVDGVELVSRADVGATIDAIPAEPDGRAAGWRAKLDLVLAVTEVNDTRQFPLRRVRGLRD